MIYTNKKTKSSFIGMLLAAIMMIQLLPVTLIQASAAEINLAIGLEVIGSEGWSGTMPSCAFDEDRETYWQAKAYPVKGRYVGVDAGEGETITFNKVVLSEMDASGVFRSTGFNIEISNDLKTWQSVATGTTIGEYDLDVYFKTVTARAVRFVITSSVDAAVVMIKEMEVYYDETYQVDDSNVKTEYKITTANIALNKSAIGTEGSSVNTVKNAFDGNTDTYWMPEKTDDEIYLAMDSGEEIMTTFNCVKITEKAVGIIPVCRITSWKLQYSRDLRTWLDIPGASGKTIGEEGKIIVFPTLNTRSVKLVIESTIGLAPAIAEFGVYNDTSLNSIDSNEKGDNVQNADSYTFIKPEIMDVILNRTLVDLDTQPVSVNDTKMIPLRGIYEAAGGSVLWSEADSTVTATYRNNVFKATLGDSTAYLNGIATKMPFPPISIDNRIQLPLEVVCDALGATLNYRSEQNAAYITLAPESADVLLDENFENTDNYRLSREWKVICNDTTRGVTVTTDETGNKCMKIDDFNAEQTVAALKTLPEVKGTVNVSFRLRFNQNTSFQIRFLSGEKYLFEVLFRENEYNVIDGNSKQKISPYAESVWYNFKLKMNTETGEFTITMLDANGTVMGEYLGKTTNPKTDSVTGLTFFSQGATTGVVLIDDILVTTENASFVDDGTFFVETKSYKPNAFTSHAKVRTLESLEGFEKKDIPIGKYGGRLDKTYEATGFFRTEKIDGRWWIIDPEGHPYFDRSPACVEYNDANAATVEKFGKDTQKWLDYTIDTLKEYGFTGMGCWSSDTININSEGKRIPYTYKLNANTYFSEVKKKYPQTKLNTNEVFPVFDKEFEEYCDNIYKELEPLKNDPYLIGYFTANEIPLGGSGAITALDKYLALDPNDPGCVQSYDAAWKWFREKCGEDADVSMLNNEIREQFRAYVFGKFNEVSSKYIKKYDPNHLTIGTRMHGAATANKVIWEECAKYLDIISVNVYHYWDVYKYGTFGELVDHPFIVTEYYVKSDESALANTSGAGHAVASLNDKGLFYQTFGYGMLNQKNCVGTQWFTYQDNGECNSGLMSADYIPYTEPLAHVKEFNDQIYNIIDYIDAKN